MSIKQELDQIIIYSKCLVDLEEILSLPAEEMAQLINRAVSGNK